MPGEDIYSWSTTAANNDDADTSINWREGQSRASVNDSARSQMAAHAKQRDLLTAQIITGGTADAQTFVSGATYTSIPTGMRVMLKIGTGLTNTTATTLNMDSIANTPLKMSNGDELTAGQVVGEGYIEVRYNGTYWVLLSTTGKLVVPGGISTPTINATTITGTTINATTINTTTVVTTGNISTSADLVTTGQVIAGAPPGYLRLREAGSERFVQFQDQTHALGFDTVSGFLRWYAGGAINAVFSFNGDFTIAGEGYKPGGGVWAASSDARIKNIVGEYTSGLSEIISLTPVRYTFKGNDGENAADGKEYIGLIAQDVEESFPEMVTKKAGSIDGKPVTDLRMLNATALIYALVNSVQDLAARLDELEARAR